MFKLHPFEMTPTSPVLSSTTKSDQLPMGLMPVKTDNALLV